MASSSSSSLVSPNEFKQIHSIDRQLYTILVINLFTDPIEAMQIMALWLWLESLGYMSVVQKMVSLPLVLISELADEAVTCLNIIKGTFFTLPFDTPDIPLTKTFMQKEIFSLHFFHENQLAAAEGTHKALTTVCFPAFRDIVKYATERNFALARHPPPPAGHSQVISASPSPSPSPSPSSSSSIHHATAHPQHIPRHQLHHQQQPPLFPPTERTMFVTFSRGYPVNEHEVKHFFNTTFGECVESLQMQEVPTSEHPLFARVVFYSPATVEAILQGTHKAKFTVNGKHIWVRRFEPRRTRPALLPHPMASELPPDPFGL